MPFTIEPLMRPKNNSIQLLASVRSRAKMHEFRAAEADYNEFTRAPDSLVVLAIGILGDSAAALADRFITSDTESAMPRSWDEPDGSIRDMVHFSARYFDAFLESRLDEDLTNEFSLLCATSYYLSDSIGSAAVVMKRTESPALELGHGLAFLAYRILKGLFAPVEESFAHHLFANRMLAALRAFYALQGGAEEIRLLCEELKAHAYLAGSARELLYADVVIALVSRKLDGAARTLLPPSSGLDLADWAPALRKGSFPTELWPAQRLLCEQGILSGRSAVIQMPTSAGKTRATEFLIRAHFLAQRSSLVVIVGPFRSLCHDIRSDLVRSFAGEDVLINEISDSYLFDIDLAGARRQNSVFVVTPEKLLYMLRRKPEFAEEVGLVVYDEGHQFDGLTRGPTYELLLASMRISLPTNAQVVLISAVIGNAAEIAGWLVGDETAVVSGSGLLPTARNIAFASWQFERAWLRYVSPADPNADEFFVPRIVESKVLAKKGRELKVKRFPERGTTRSNTDIGLFLGQHLAANGSVAIFCGKKESVGTVCDRAVEIAGRGLELDWPAACSDENEIRKIADLCQTHLGDGRVSKAAKLGILSHHANTPPGLRLSIEHAMKAGVARMVVCTSTLAQGVNFPIRYLVVTSTQQGKEEIAVRDFHNLMGRAGRAGMYTEGNVIFSAPSLYDDKKKDGRWRWSKTTRLLDADNSEPSASSILKLFVSFEQKVKGKPTITLDLPTEWLDLTFATKQTIAAYTAAAVSERPGLIGKDFSRFLSDRARAVQSIASYLLSYVDFESDLAEERVEELARSTLAYHLSDDDLRVKVLAVFQAAAKAVQQGTDLSLIKLVRKSPLPPADVKALAQWIDMHLDRLAAIETEEELLTAIMEKAARHAHAPVLAAVPEAMRPDCLADWIAGRTYYEIRARLTAAHVKFGNARATSEHVVHLCESGYAYDLSMVVAALADLVEERSEDLHARLVTVQKKIKYGLSSDAAIAFQEAGFADRVVAQALGDAFPVIDGYRDVVTACRTQRELVLATIEPFPRYFEEVALELSSGYD
ncbi:DEAD/DEAH box helicase [Mesorhizobium opportunistum]|uniref:DEAD/DEAH box helicase n=1 Tax=Mesorhizobium opportunistum TaxID=593909 RepID=UPI0033399E72